MKGAGGRKIPSKADAPETERAARRTTERRKARHWGLKAETLGTLYLRLKFYRILARSYSVRAGEIDIIAQRGDTIAFVEVKARADLAQAADAIGAQKRARMSRAARAWIARNAGAGGKTFRGDALLITPRFGRFYWPIHWPGALELDLD